jgi:hypothetical protein
LQSAAVWAGSKAAGYNWRALIEADISRYKRVIGGVLRSRTDQRQATETARRRQCSEPHAERERSIKWNA